VHPITTHAHKGVAGKALVRAHHTASPGDKRRQGRRAPKVRFRRRRACKPFSEMEGKGRAIRGAKYSGFISVR